MTGLRGIGRYAALAVIAGASALPAAAAERVAEGARIGVHSDKTRFVLDLDGPVTFETFTLPDPYRVVVDLPPIEWRLDPTGRTRGGLISDFRFGRFSADVSRVVLDVTGPVRVARAFTLPPGRHSGHRLVLDLVRTSRAAFLETLKPTPRGAEPAPVPAARPRRGPDDKPVIALDPGHGGVDPGATSASGIFEKNVTLGVARVVRKALLATGRYRVAMTRDDDVFVRLRERIAISRRAGAELFVSLHADVIANPRFRGGSVYTLSEKASDAEAEALARKENRADLIAGVDLSAQNDQVVNILIDLAQRETMNESAIFARELVEEIGKYQHLLKRAHRFAGFAVLKAPDVPSVLIELGYLSNRLDERMLLNPRHRAKVARAIVAAIDAYFVRQQALNRP